MGFLKKITIKILLIILVFMIIISLGSIKFLNGNFIKARDYTFDSHYENVISNLNDNIGILEVITKRISENEKIIKILDDNKYLKDLDSEEANIIQKEINTFQRILENLTYVKTINIFNSQGNYLLSNEVIYEDFNLEDRPWFKEDIFKNNCQSFISDIHMDYITEKYTISIISLIKSEKDNSILGVAMLDIFIDDLIESINSSFYAGKMETYIKIDDESYYGKDGVVSSDNEFGNKYYLKISGEDLENGLNILLKFDKNSTIYSQIIKEYSNIQGITYVILGIILTIILFIILRSTLKPIETCLDKFKVLLKNSANSDFNFEIKDELEQLEFVSTALSKSFDNTVKSLIYYDDLTKLPNRKMLNKRVKELIELKNDFALIFIDLNRFKEINDLFGHLTGDEMLKVFARKIQGIIKDTDMISRYSGDEFIIVYTDYKGEKELIDFYENNILEEFSKAEMINGNSINIDFSAGVAVYPKDGESLDELINKSDFMMYEIKHNIESKKIEFFNDDIYNEIQRVEIIKSELKKGIDKNEFMLYYQPIVNKNKYVKKAEVLIRWNNEKLGFVPTLDFIKYAEETRDIIEIGYWIIENVFKNYKELTDGYKDKLQVSINVSPIQLMEINFVDNIKNIAEKYNIDYKYICFEITESVMIDKNSVALKNIKIISELGIKIALDDFGTGYSSFSYLKKFNLDILKIDKIFIDNANEIDYEIVKNIKNIANLLSMEVVIEGIETLDQFNRLKDIDCDFFQGYYFSKPVTFKEMKEILNK